MKSILAKTAGARRSSFLWTDNQAIRRAGAQTGVLHFNRTTFFQSSLDPDFILLFSNWVDGFVREDLVPHSWVSICFLRQRAGGGGLAGEGSLPSDVGAGLVAEVKLDRDGEGLLAGSLVFGVQTTVDALFTQMVCRHSSRPSSACRGGSMTGSMTFSLSWPSPEEASMTRVWTMARKAAWLGDFGITGLTLPSMMERTRLELRKDELRRPVRGPEARRRSLQTFVSLTALHSGRGQRRATSDVAAMRSSLLRN